MPHYRVQIGDLIKETEADSVSEAWSKVAEAEWNLGTLPKVDISFVTDLETLRVRAINIMQFGNHDLVVGKE